MPRPLGQPSSCGPCGTRGLCCSSAFGALALVVPLLYRPKSDCLPLLRPPPEQQIRERLNWGRLPIEQAQAPSRRSSVPRSFPEAWIPRPVSRPLLPVSLPMPPTQGSSLRPSVAIAYRELPVPALPRRLAKIQPFPTQAAILEGQKTEGLLRRSREDFQAREDWVHRSWQWLDMAKETLQHIISPADTFDGSGFGFSRGIRRG